MYEHVVLSIINSVKLPEDRNLRILQTALFSIELQASRVFIIFPKLWLSTLILLANVPLGNHIIIKTISFDNLVLWSPVEQ